MDDSQSEKKRSSKGRILVVAKLLISFGLLALLFRWIDVQQLIEDYSHLRWGWLALGVALLQTQILNSTLKWKVILRAGNHDLPYLFLLKTYMIGGFLSLFLPSSFGGDFYRVWALKGHDVKLTRSTASVLFDRATGVWALMTISLVGACVLVPTTTAVLLGLLYLAGLAFVFAITSDAIVKRLPKPKSKLLNFPVSMLKNFNLFRKRKRLTALMMGLSLTFQFNVVLIVTCYARALRISPQEVSFWDFTTAVPLIYLTEMLPISINGIGVRDSAFVYFFKQLGVAVEHGLALSLLLVAIRYLNGLVGGALFLHTVWANRFTKTPGAIADTGSSQQPGSPKLEHPAAEPTVLPSENELR